MCILNQNFKILNISRVCLVPQHNPDCYIALEQLRRNCVQSDRVRNYWCTIDYVQLSESFDKGHK